MAAIALTLGETLYDPLGRLRAGSLLAQARALTVSALNRALGPAAEQEGRLFATLVEAAAPNIAAQTRQQAQQTATGLVGLLRAASAAQTAGSGLLDALAGMLPGVEALGIKSALFARTSASTVGGTAQVNAGRAFLADLRHQAPRAVNTFSLVVGRQTFELRATLGPRDTNRDALAKIADAINGAGAAVRAEVQEARADGVSVVRLRIAATRPDTTNPFSLLDRLGNVIGYSGANQGETSASTPANTQQRGGETAQVAVEVQVPGALSAEGQGEAVAFARQVASGFSEVLTQAAALPLRPEITVELARTAQEAASPLAAAGVTVAADGQLKVDEERLKATLARAATAQTTVSALRTLGDRLSATARALSEVPVSALLQPLVSLPAPASDAGPLVPTPTAPITSMLRSYQVTKQQLDLADVLALLRGGLIINVVL